MSAEAIAHRLKVQVERRTQCMSLSASFNLMEPVSLTPRGSLAVGLVLCAAQTCCRSSCFVHCGQLKDVVHGRRVDDVVSSTRAGRGIAHISPTVTAQGHRTTLSALWSLLLLWALASELSAACSGQRHMAAGAASAHRLERPNLGAVSVRSFVFDP